MLEHIRGKQIIDLTTPWEDDMVMNHPSHPRAPIIWASQRYEFTTDFLAHTWRMNGGPVLYGGLPDRAMTAGSGHGWEGTEANGWMIQQILIGTHMGTHMDAAIHHCAIAHQTIADVPLEKCVGEAVILDLRHLCAEPYEISRRDLDEAERVSGTSVGDGDIVIIHTGWAARWGYGANADRKRYGETAHAENPGLGTDAAPWFIARNVKIVGSDGFNLDHDSHFANHWNFLFRELINREPIQVIENLVNLERIHQSRFFFLGLPAPIRSGSGSPIRALAFVDPHQDDGGV